MFNLAASLSFAESEVIVKANDPILFGQIVQTVTALNQGESVDISGNSEEDDRLAFEVYLEYCQGVGENLSVISVNNRLSVRCYARVLFENKKLFQIDRKAMFEIKNNIPKLPVYLYAKDFYKGNLFLKDLPSFGKTLKTIPSSSQERIFKTLTSFFNWCVSKGYKINNPFDKQKFFCEKKDDKVVAYTQADLKALFEGDAFDKYTYNFSCRYWASLISLFMGARRGEITALDLSDVIVDKSGRWYLYIRKDTSVPNKKKLVKNSHSVRLIPIHQKLMELGFDRYYQTIKNEGYPVLFPDINIRSTGLTDYDCLSISFANYRRALKIEGHKTFHSLRHNAISCLKHKKCHLPDIQQLVGHAFGNITFDIYGEPSDMTDMVNLVNKISYDLDIKPWQDSSAKKHTRERVWNKSKINLRINS